MSLVSNTRGPGSKGSLVMSGQQTVDAVQDVQIQRPRKGEAMEVWESPVSQEALSRKEPDGAEFQRGPCCSTWLSWESAETLHPSRTSTKGPSESDTL